MGNTVNPDNFNETMDGYFRYALNFARSHAEFTNEQIALLNNGMTWAKDDLTMSEAREYFYYGKLPEQKNIIIQEFNPNEKIKDE